MTGLEFGSQTVTFVGVAATGVLDELGTSVLAETPVDVTGCRHRPISPAGMVGPRPARMEEGPEVGISVAIEWWKTTAPPAAAALAAKSSDLIRVDGSTYRIIGGVKAFVDIEGRPFKVTILSEKQEIG